MPAKERDSPYEEDEEQPSAREKQQLPSEVEAGEAVETRLATKTRFVSRLGADLRRISQQTTGLLEGATRSPNPPGASSLGFDGSVWSEPLRCFEPETSERTANGIDEGQDQDNDQKEVDRGQRTPGENPLSDVEDEAEDGRHTGVEAQADTDQGKEEGICQGEDVQSERLRFGTTKVGPESERRRDNRTEEGGEDSLLYCRSSRC